MRPHRAQPVVVRLPGRDDLRAYVTEADDDRVTFVLAVREQPLDAADGSPAVIEYTSASGVHRLTGHMVRDAEGSLHLDRRRPEEIHIQRREWARVDATIPAELELRDVESGRHESTVVNVSGGGALVADPIGLPLGAQLELRLLFGTSVIRAQAEVVRVTPHNEKGVRITAISDTDREFIIRFVAQRQREELARRREVAR